MRKTILRSGLLLAAGLTLGLSQGAQAQYRGRGGNVSLGLKAGGVLSNFVGADAGNPDYRLGFQIGGFANIGLSRLVAFQPELLYSQKGAWAKGSTDVGTRLNYIDIPLAFHVNTDGFFFEAGPQLGFLVGANFQTGSVSTDVKNQLNTVDFGYLFGLGYQLKQGVGIGLRYNGAFTNIPNSVTVGNSTYQNRTRNSAFQLYVSYSFN